MTWFNGLQVGLFILAAWMLAREVEHLLQRLFPKRYFDWRKGAE